MRVLLVEDDADLSRQLKAALGDAGYAVDHAPDGEEAHYLGENEPYDVIVLDLGLPKIDGVSVLERWRREGKTTPGPDPDGARRLVGQGSGLRRRRRRLSDQALPYRGASGASAGPAASFGGHRLGDPVVRGLAAGSPRRAGQRQRRAAAADVAGVPAAALHDDASGPRHQPDRAGRTSVRPGFRPGFQHHRGLHRPGPQEGGA